MPSESSSTDEIHKWKACLGCGHPQHSRRCQAGDVDECGCIELTSTNDIIDLCRRSGGCPKHPILEPKGSASSSPDDECGVCGHYRANHEGNTCFPCPRRDRQNRHAFVPAEPEPVECRSMRTRGAHCFDHGPSCCNCGAKLAPTAAQEADEDCTCSSGETDGNGRIMHYNGCGMTEPEAPECTHPNPYTYGLESGPPVRRFRYCQDCKTKWETVGDEPAPADDPPRRPPYAVAYAIEGGALYEIALPGDATVRAEDGALIITHPSAVLALTQARPMEG